MLVVAASTQPLPPNMVMTLVANVTGTTRANNAYWADKCTTIPSNAVSIVVDIGTVRDFFKPTDGNSYCDMLQSTTKHQWSGDGLTWITPGFYNDENCANCSCSEGQFSTITVGNGGASGKTITLPSADMICPANVNRGTPEAVGAIRSCSCNDNFKIDVDGNQLTAKRTNGGAWGVNLQFKCRAKPTFTGDNCKSPLLGLPCSSSGDGCKNLTGGSVDDWPRDKGSDGDERKHLSFWGYPGQTGGCCSSSAAVYSTGWGQSCK